MKLRPGNRRAWNGKTGIATVEMAMVLPLMIIMVFAIIDFGRLIQARIIVTNIAREGGSLASRDALPVPNLVAMLQAGGTPLNMIAGGRIYIWRISAGTSARSPDPWIDPTLSASAGGLNVPSSISSGQANLGLTSQLYRHLEFDPDNQSSDISNVTVVEVFYKYSAITPISKFVSGVMTDGGGEIVSSKAVF